MKITNLTNAVGTLTAFLTVLTGLLTSLGCAPTTMDFTATCAIPWLPQQWLGYVTIAAGGIFGVSAILLKLTRPGGWLHSLFGSTAVVVPAANANSGIGTVTPTQVATK